MLGNMCHEGNIGHLENVNAGTNTGYGYWNRINECRIPPDDEEHKDYTGPCYYYKPDFANKHLYEVDYQVYRQLVQQDMDNNKSSDKVIGCGCVQWTQKVRFKLLMSYYDAADANGDNNGQLSYEECLQAETQCMAYELTHNYKDEAGGSCNYKREVTDVWTTTWSTGDEDNKKIENSAESAADAAAIICDVYENPDSTNSKRADRIKDAGELYGIMMGENG